jgi:hypothetical protein
VENKSKDTEAAEKARNEIKGLYGEKSRLIDHAGEFVDIFHVHLDRLYKENEK